MKKFVSCLPLVLLGALVVGCGDGEPRKSTDGADQQAIADYEAAVAAMEQQDADANIGAEDSE